jgi:dienelactone hydrolase
MKWFPSHGADVTHKPLRAVIAALQEQGVTTFGATGYCFGARYAFDLAFENVTAAIVVSHPSLLNAPADFEVRASGYCPEPHVT